MIFMKLVKMKFQIGNFIEKLNKTSDLYNKKFTTEFEDGYYKTKGFKNVICSVLTSDNILITASLYKPNDYHSQKILGILYTSINVDSCLIQIWQLIPKIKQIDYIVNEKHEHITSMELSKDEKILITCHKNMIIVYSLEKYDKISLGKFNFMESKYTMCRFWNNEHIIVYWWNGEKGHIELNSFERGQLVEKYATREVVKDDCVIDSRKIKEISGDLEKFEEMAISGNNIILKTCNDFIKIIGINDGETKFSRKHDREPIYIQHYSEKFDFKLYRFPYGEQYKSKIIVNNNYILYNFAEDPDDFHILKRGNLENIGFTSRDPDNVICDRYKDINLNGPFGDILDLIGQYLFVDVVVDDDGVIYIK